MSKPAPTSPYLSLRDAARLLPTEVGDPRAGLVNCPRCGDPLLCIRVSGGWLRVCEACRPPGPRRTNPALDPKPAVVLDVCVAVAERCST